MKTKYLRSEFRQYIKHALLTSFSKFGLKLLFLLGKQIYATMHILIASLILTEENISENCQ
jgi:hypothetical protein